MSVRRLADAAVQPAAFAFSRANAAWAKQAIRKYPKGREQSAVIPLLMRAQEQEGWVTKAAIEHVADMLGMPYIRALEVATFYTQFQLKPVGSRAHVQVCGTTPCMLRGSEALMDVCRSKIHPDQFHTNAAGTLSWEEVECLGACVNAPMVMIFKDAYEDLTPERLAEILDAFEAGKGASVPAGPQNGRVHSAPITGLTTLKDEKPILKASRDKEERARGRDATTVGEQKPVDGAPVPPTKAAKPKTFSMDTNAAVKSPSPQKASVAGEKAASVKAPKEDSRAANKAEPLVEAADKQRKGPSRHTAPVTTHAAPETLHGGPIGPAGKRRVGEAVAPEGEPSPEGKPRRARKAARNEGGAE